MPRGNKTPNTPALDKPLLKQAEEYVDIEYKYYEAGQEYRIQDETKKEEVETEDQKLARHNKEQFLPMRREVGEYRIAKTPTDRVIRAYQDYLEMGPSRSFGKLAKMYQEHQAEYGPMSVPTTSEGTIRIWSSRYQWPLQVRLDESHMAKIRIESRRESARQIADRQSNAAIVIQRIGMMKLQELVDKGQLTAEGRNMSAAEARRFVLDGSKMERDLVGGSLARFKDEDDDEITYE